MAAKSSSAKWSNDQILRLIEEYEARTRRHFILFTFLRGKSLEVAARVTLLARLPVNYRQLSRTSLTV